MPSQTRRLVAALVLLVAAAACRPAFVVTKFPTNEALYKASLSEFRKEHWDNAVSGFDKLTLDLGVRDSLLVPSYWYLGVAHQRAGDDLLAAQAFSRLTESFPDDSLAPAAALRAGEAYQRMWKDPTLDETYGETALQTYTMLIQLYAQTDSAVADSARQKIATLNEWFAQKEYETAFFYFRNKAWDSSILYFKDIVAKWPETKHARLSMLRLAEAYRTIHYSEDLGDICRQMRSLYPGDKDVARDCRGVKAPADTTAAPPDTSRGGAGQAVPPR
ncbi:MAG: outer membrane protein assembly factor BamD [Gemmatimonadota bacterium]|nr:outer membrane protein assembly factor BamD [Gemmatimonadota bacterium]MDE3173645.1 outer membrane protein assembly factor BamD [Gemmatimonadota bacterium]MDE3215640.1 outer membrane protein assembly factor BamD [Gemmatimonadota bacterium]